MLEQRLLEYGGTILLVSHDRAFLNNVVTSTIVFEGDGRLEEYVGGYDDWLRQRREPAAPQAPKAVKEEKPGRRKAPQEKRKLSFKESRELEALPQDIEALEKEKAQIIAALSSPEFYTRSNPNQVSAANARLEELEAQLDLSYRRWEELEELESKYSQEQTPKL